MTELSPVYGWTLLDSGWTLSDPVWPGLAPRIHTLGLMHDRLHHRADPACMVQPKCSTRWAEVGPVTCLDLCGPYWAFGHSFRLVRLSIQVQWPPCYGVHICMHKVIYLSFLHWKKECRICYLAFLFYLFPNLMKHCSSLFHISNAI